MDWKATLASFAPKIALALGGPMAGVAVKAGLSIFGIEDGDEKQLLAAVSGATHEQLLALKKADQDFAARMKELDIDLERIMSGDRDSARKMQIETRSYTVDFLAVFVTFGFFGMLGFMLTQPVPPENKDVLNIMLGSLGTAWVTIIGFFFGSSYGSSFKDQTIKAFTSAKEWVAR